MARPQDQEIQSVYPTTLDTFTHLPELDDRHNKVHRELQRGLEQVQSTMGLSPQGAYSTMRSRLDDVQGTESHFLDSTNDPASPFVVNPLHSDFGAVGDASTDDTAALQAAIDYARTVGKPVWIPAQFAVSAPIKLYGGMELIAANGGSIDARSDFDFSAESNTAVVELYSSNNNRYAIGRIMIYGRLNINCNNRTGSRGFLASLQQQSEIHGLRINQAREESVIIKGQQAQFHDLMVVAPTDDTGTQLGLKIDTDGKFFSFYGLNIEKATTAMEINGGPNWFYGVHIEQQGITNAKAIVQNAGWFLIDGAWWSCDDTSQTFLDAGGGYMLRHITLKSGSTECIAIEDTALPGGQLTTWTDFREYVNWYAKTPGSTSDSYTQPYVWTLQGPESRRLSLGGTEPADPQILAQAATSQTGDMLRMVDSGGTARFRIEDTGHPVMPSYTDATRPAANGVPAGTTIYNTDDNAPNISDGTNWRDAAGTVT